MRLSLRFLKKSNALEGPIKPDFRRKSSLQSTRNRASGNALMEYVVPAVLILASSGVLVTIADTTGLMPMLYLSSSGRDATSLTGTTLVTNGLDENSFGYVYNGSAGFTNYGSLSSASGGKMSNLYYGPVARFGSRVTGVDPDYLFP